MKQINLTAEQITRSYPKRNKTMISGETGADGGICEKEYISFEPYHVIGTVFKTIYRFDNKNEFMGYTDVITGYFFDADDILQKFVISKDAEKGGDNFRWEYPFIEKALQDKRIICDYEGRKLHLVCDGLSLAHTHAASTAGLLFSRQKVIRTKQVFMDLYDDYEKFRAMSRNELKKYSSKAITTIKAPKFERNPENKDAKTFDRIRCEISVKSFDENGKKLSVGEAAANVRKDAEAVFDDVLRRIESSTRWKHFGIPINVLKCTSAKVCFDYVLELIFEIKEELK